MRTGAGGAPKIALLDLALFLLVLPLTYLFLDRTNLAGTEFVSFKIRSPQTVTLALRHAASRREEYAAGGTAEAGVRAAKSFSEVYAKIAGAVRVTKLAVRLEGISGGTVQIRRIQLQGRLLRSKIWQPDEIASSFTPVNAIAGFAVKDGSLELQVSGANPEFELARFPGYLRSEAITVCVAALLAIFVIAAFRAATGPSWPATRLRDAVFATLFLAAICLHFTAGALGLSPDAPTTEKRALATKPELSLRSLLTFPSAFEAWFNDHFSLRAPLIQINHSLKVRRLRTSPVPQQVVLGEDGWLFYVGEDELDNYIGRRPFEEEDLEKIRQALMERKRWLEERGIRYYVMLIPNKSTVYREHMPRYIPHREPTKLDQLLVRLGPDFAPHVVDVRARLLEQKSEERVYFQTDTHWNHAGAYTGYRALMERLRQDFPALRVVEPADLTRTDVPDFSGDLATMLSLDNLLTERTTLLALKKPEAVPAENPYPFPGVGIMPTTVFRKPSGSGPTVVVFQDSFFLAMQAMFVESFARSVCVWSLDFREEIVEQERPDIVIEEVVERNVDLRLFDVRTTAARRAARRDQG